MSTEIQLSQQSRIERAETFAPRSITEAFQFADMVLLSGMAPKSYLEIYDKAITSGLTADAATMKAKSAVVVALQFGMEVGFQPMQALQCIANINGNPSVWGDGALALVQSSGLLEWIKEDDLDVIKANKKATCQVKRRGDPVVKTITFTYQDAIDGGIMGRGVWKTYPYRMCLMRSRAFCLRDKFPDVLKGLKIAEEVMDLVESEPTPEQPRIAATITVPIADAVSTAGTAQVAADKPAESNTGQVEAPATITIPQAKDFYKAYSASGYLPEESKTWLKENLGITDSRLIKPEDYGDCMAWANTPKVAEQAVEEWTGTLENMDAEPA